LGTYCWVEVIGVGSGESGGSASGWVLLVGQRPKPPRKHPAGAITIGPVSLIPSTKISRIKPSSGSRSTKTILPLGVGRLSVGGGPLSVVVVVRGPLVWRARVASVSKRGVTDVVPVAGLGSMVAVGDVIVTTEGGSSVR